MKTIYMQETKNLVEEALIQMKNVEEVIAENAKGILASTMKEEISQLVKESLSEQEDDEVEFDTELDMLDMGGEVEDMEDSEELDMGREDMDFDDMEDTIDMTDMTDEEVIKAFKAMGPEDGIVVVKDGDEIHLTDESEDTEYIVKLEESEMEEEDEMMEEEDEMMEGEDMMEDEMDFSELDMQEDADLDAVIEALYSSRKDNSEDEIMYEIEMDEEEMEEELEEMMDEENSDMMEYEMASEDYDLTEAKMTVKPKGVGMGHPKFKYDSTLPKKGFDDHKKAGPKTMGTGKAKFEFKEGEMEEGNDFGSKKHEYKRKKVDGVEKKAGEGKDGHFKDYEGKFGGNKGDKSKTQPGKKDYETKEETKEAARTYGMGSKEGRGLRKGITNNRNYVYGNNGVKVESIDAELKMLREKNEEYRKALNVFREKLNEVAVFNSNLAYATRLFTEHSTTKKEKINILRRFDSVESLKESKQLYKTVKDELSHTETKNISESVERQLNSNKTSGSATTLIESKTYENPQFLRIKDLMSKL
jgi:hypothetical protein